MKNIMKSIWFEILHSKMLIRIYIGVIIMMILTGILNVNIEDQLSGASGMLVETPVMTYEFSLFITAIIVGVICGEDYKDKVANYEVLSGHSRISIFLARSLFAIITSSVLAVFLSFIPVITGTIIGGWGGHLEIGDVIVRQLLLFFPFIRFAAFMAVITFLVKNHFVMMASGFFVMMSGTLLIDILHDTQNSYISLFNMNWLVSYKGWSIYNVDPVQGVVDYSSYNSAFTSSMVLQTIFVSLAVAAFYLFMGYALFRRDELN